jgi:sulfide:quinone oxidoreductase
MTRTKVLVLGSNFGGLTAAIAVKHDLKGDVDVTVISPSDRFVFNPSLIWLPFGKRNIDDITFPVGPTFEDHDVDFVHAPTTELQLAKKERRRCWLSSTPGSGLDAGSVATDCRTDRRRISLAAPEHRDHRVGLFSARRRPESSSCIGHGSLARL